MDRRAATRGTWLHRARRAAAQLRGAARSLRTPAVALLLLAVVALLAAGCTPEVSTSTSLPGSGSTATTHPAGSTATTSATATTSTTQPPAEETSTTQSGPPVVKIGALFPLTGDLAAEGESGLKGMRLAVEEVNAAGGIQSMDGARLTLVEMDSKGDAAGADAAVAQLVQTEGVAAIVGTGQSTVALKATDAAERLQVPFLVTSGAADEITERGLGYTFRLCPKAAWYARDQVAFLKTLTNSDGSSITAVALLHENGEFGTQTAKSQKEYLTAAGIQVVADVEVPGGPGRPAQRTHNRPAERGPGHLDRHTAGRRHRDRRVRLSVAPGPAHHRCCRRGARPGLHSQRRRRRRIDDERSRVRPGLASSSGLEQKLAASGTALDADMLYGYQAVYVLASALERGGSAEGPVLRGALKTTALYGEHLVLPQSLLTFDANGQNFGARLVVVQVQNGRMTAVWPSDYAEGAVRLP